MSEAETPDPPRVEEVQARLHDVALLLRGSDSVDPEARRTLAELVDELGTALRAGGLPAEEVSHLAGTTSHLIEALHHKRDAGWLSGLADRVREAAAQAEVQAPTASGLARRVVETLAGIGI